MLNIPESFRVFVDEERIVNSECGDKDNCAVSLAVNDYFDDSIYTKTRSTSYFLTDTCVVTFVIRDDDDVEYQYYFKGNDNFVLWVNAFDEGLDVKPIYIDFKVDEKRIDKKVSEKYVCYHGSVTLDHKPEYELSKLEMKMKEIQTQND